MQLANVRLATTYPWIGRVLYVYRCEHAWLRAPLVVTPVARRAAVEPAGGMLCVAELVHALPTI